MFPDWVRIRVRVRVGVWCRLIEFPFDAQLLTVLIRKRVKDAIKRLDADAKEGGGGSDSDSEGLDFIDPFHPDLFRPFVKKEESGKKDDDGFTIPRPIKVRKTNKKDESGTSSCLADFLICNRIPGPR